jgi:hypothetical protein
MGGRTDLSGEIGYHSQSDLAGFVLMPFYDFTNTSRPLAAKPMCKATTRAEFAWDAFKIGSIRAAGGRTTRPSPGWDWTTGWRLSW